MMTELIKQLMSDIAEAREQEETPFPEAEKVARELGLVKEGEEAKANPVEDKARIVAYWRGRAHTMTDSELRSKIGNDLEGLDYNPDDVAKMVPQVIKAIRK